MIFRDLYHNGLQPFSDSLSQGRKPSKKSMDKPEKAAKRAKMLKIMLLQDESESWNAFQSILPISTHI